MSQQLIIKVLGGILLALLTWEAKELLKDIEELQELMPVNLENRLQNMERDVHRVKDILMSKK